MSEKISSPKISYTSIFPSAILPVTSSILIVKIPLLGFGEIETANGNTFSSIPIVALQLNAISCAPVTHPLLLQPVNAAVLVPVAPIVLKISSAISIFSFPQGLLPVVLTSTRSVIELGGTILVMLLFTLQKNTPTKRVQATVVVTLFATRAL